MQDILLKKVSPPVSSGQTPLKMKKRRFKLSFTSLEPFFSRLNQVGGKVKTVLDSEGNHTVITHTQHAPVIPPKVSKLIAKKQIKAARKEMRAVRIQRVKSRGKEVVGHIRTPLGKVALVQTVALLAVFGYALHSGGRRNGQTAEFSQRTAGQTISQTPIRRYFPSIGQYVAPKVFDEQVARAQFTQLPLQAWLTPWNIGTQKEYASHYSSISAFWLTVDANGYDLSPKADWTQWEEYKTKNKPATQSAYLTVSGDPNIVASVLLDPLRQKKLATRLLTVVEQQGFDGIDLDFEGLGRENRNIFTEFIQTTTELFHSRSKKVGVTLESRLGNDVPMDWQGISGVADQVRVMVYDYHARQTNNPGPVAAIGWLKEVLDYAQSTIDPQKLSIGLGNYGYDWTKDAEQESWQGIGIGFDQAIALAEQQKSPIIRATGIDSRGYDIGSIPTFSYLDTEGRQHQVWFEDNESLQAKLALVNQYRTKGVILWSVGLGDPHFWQAVTNP